MANGELVDWIKTEETKYILSLYEDPDPALVAEVALIVYGNIDENDRVLIAKVHS